MIYAEILAGGKGTRMGNTDLPKQFLMLGDKPILIHTLEQFVISSKFNKIIVCCPKEWVTYTKDLLDKYMPNSGIEIVVGGATRNETIMNGCKYIKDTYGLNNDDIIVTHDAVRPFISQRIIEDNVSMAKKCDAVDTVIPATDTIVASKDGKVISDIPNRSELYQGQTPQSFNIIKLMKIYDSLSEKEKDILTDACKIFVMKKKEVRIVEGETFNIKITNMSDLKIANAILMERGNK